MPDARGPGAVLNKAERSRPRLPDLARCREILGPSVNLDDDQLIRLRTSVFGLAQIIVDQYEEKCRLRTKT